MSSISPQTLAIGGAVAVVGGYFLLRGGVGGSSDGTGLGIGTGSIPANQVLAGDDDGCPQDELVKKIVDAGGVASKVGGWPVIAGSVVDRYADKTPTMPELNELRLQALKAGKAAVAAGNYADASKQYGLLRGYEQLVLKNKVMGFATSHEKDPYCKNPLSAQLLKLMMPMMTDMMTKQFNDLLDTAEANVKAGNFTVAGGNLWAFDKLFSKFYSGGGSDLPFTGQIKARYDSLREDVDAGSAAKTVASSEDRIMGALNNPARAPLMLTSPEELRVFNGIYPVYAMYLAKKNDPDVNVRLSAAKALLALPTWFINRPEINAFIMKTRDDVNQQKKTLATVSAATASATSTVKTIGAGLEHLLADNAYAIMAEQWVKMSLDQQKAYTAQLTQEQKDKLRQAILARKAREGR